MLRFDNLGKRYGDRILFERLHFDATSGCVALNDDSGSGKSTLLGIVAGAIEADAGDVWLGGQSLRAARHAAQAVLTYVPEDNMNWPDQTGRDYLQQVASARQSAVTRDVLAFAERFGLAPHLDKRFEQMSYGSRKKVFLTAALLGETRVLLADEPAGGLDASARAVLADLFRTLAASRTVFFTSYDEAFTQACEATRISFADLASGA
ncbi:ABC transporter ATP-binding protein [Paraburkholderia sp.]|uniref:ABC transporter ATP-binding protein n=1 Tax=Paraburkholderia sp. TaxID=1926495 RepID=UPI002F4195BE